MWFWLNLFCNYAMHYWKFAVFFAVVATLHLSKVRNVLYSLYVLISNLLPYFDNWARIKFSKITKKFLDLVFANFTGWRFNSHERKELIVLFVSLKEYKPNHKILSDTCVVEFAGSTDDTELANIFTTFLISILNVYELLFIWFHFSLILRLPVTKIWLWYVIQYRLQQMSPR